jgi:hypothetical protein
MRGWLSWLGALAFAVFGLQHAVNRYHSGLDSSWWTAALFSVHLWCGFYGLLSLTTLLSSRHRSETTRQLLWSAFMWCVFVATLAVPIAAKIELDNVPLIRAIVASAAAHSLWAGVLVLVVHARTAKQRIMDELEREELLGNAGAALGGAVAFAIMFSMLFWPGRGFVRRMLAVPVALGFHVVGGLLMGIAKAQRERFLAEASARDLSRAAEPRVA